MISASQLQQFSRECLLVRKALQEGPITDCDLRILMSDVHVLLADLIKRKMDIVLKPSDDATG